MIRYLKSEDFNEDDMAVHEEESEVRDMADNPAFDAPELGSPDIDPVDESCIDLRVNAIYRKDVSLHELVKNWDGVDCRDCTGSPNLFAERILEVNLLSDRKH
jgi:hypothetical protein